MNKGKEHGFEKDFPDQDDHSISASVKGASKVAGHTKK